MKEEILMANYVNELINWDKIDKTKLNMIISGTGTGKSYTAIKFAPELLNIQRKRILFVTSRLITIEQQYKEFISDTMIYYSNSKRDKLWSNEVNQDNQLDDKINLMTYQRFIKLVSDMATGKETLNNIDLIFLDEIHTIEIDSFIQNIGVVKTFLAEELPKNRITVIGLTATPEILLDNNPNFNIPCSHLMNEKFIKHKANQLIICDMKNLTQTIDEKCNGKTLIMVRSHNQCLSLQKKLITKYPKTKILFSTSTNEFKENLDNMKYTREYIVQNRDFPPDCDILVSTSCFREGLSLDEKSNVQNIISFWCDPLHIIQVAGRCRYDYNNLIVVKPNVWNSLNFNIPYLYKYNMAFQDFYNNKSNDEWFNEISPIIKSKDNVTFFDHEFLHYEFVHYIRDNFLVPLDKNDPQGSTFECYAIYTQSQRDEILRTAKRCCFGSVAENKLTFNKVMKLLSQLGFEIESGRKYYKGKQVRYKIIKSFTKNDNLMKPTVL